MPSYTLSAAATGGGDWGDIALRFSGSAGPGGSSSTTGSGAPSLQLATTGDHSAVACIVLDWNGVSGTTRTWLTVNGVTPTAGNGYELDYTLVSGNYGVYIAYWPDAGPAGTVTVGMSAPAGMKYTAIATEVLGTAGPPPSNQTAALPASFTLRARPAWTDAGAAMNAGVSLSATSVSYALYDAGLDAGLALTAGYDLGAAVTLPVGVGVDAQAAGWIYTGTFPVTYLQYLGAGGTLGADPGEFTTQITAASGYPYQLQVPPQDGRWESAFEGPRSMGSVRVLAPLRTRHKQHGQRSRSAYQALGAR